MTTSNTPTIIDLKTTFLRSQILALSQPLRPSQDFLTSNTSSEENALRQKAIDDALYKLNGLLKKHNKLAYGPQATRHVAEQVDRLYWNAGERGIGIVGEAWSEKGADYRNEEIISQLPEQWSEDAESRVPEQAARFSELQGKLKELDERRRIAREKVEGYRQMKALLEPFGEEGGVQENLVTKNGEVERELERMRMLMLRVERGLGGLNQKESEGDEMDIAWDEEGDKKIEAILRVRRRVMG